MTRRGIFTSDFHMFSDRSIVESILPNLEQAAGNADLIVLGGDIVDFKWSRLPDQEHTEQDAKHAYSRLDEAIQVGESVSGKDDRHTD